jgi:hypothetical protein
MGPGLLGQLRNIRQGQDSVVSREYEDGTMTRASSPVAHHPQRGLEIPGVLRNTLPPLLLPPRPLLLLLLLPLDQISKQPRMARERE